MADQSRRTGREPPQEDECINSEEEAYAALRRLVFGSELLDNLEDTERFADLLSRALPRAVYLSSGPSKKPNRRLVKALMPTVEEIVGESANRDHKKMVEALFPVVMPAIRKSIAEFFMEKIQAFSTALERSLSWQGIGWRIEALRTGTPFSEVVLLHSSLYQVLQVFLIHRETGQKLQHAAKTESVMDADMVSGMLTAIQDFVHDSFGGEDGESLHTMQYGELVIWVEQGPQAVIAGVVRGTAPARLRGVFQDILEQIHLEKSSELDRFGQEGDASIFDDVRPLLGECLETPPDTGRRRIPAWFWGATALVVIVLIVWAGFTLHSHFRWIGYLERLEKEPGIVVTRTASDDGRRVVYGLRDPLALDPDDFLSEFGFDPAEVETRWKQYQDTDDRFVLTRVRTLIDPPAGVKLGVKDGVLTISGSAERDWIERSLTAARGVPGVEDIEAGGLQAEATPLEKYLEKLAGQPGLLVLSAEKRDGRYFISGLRDPLAVDPKALLPDTGLDPEKVVEKWGPYQSFDEEMIFQRAVEALKPPSTVKMDLTGGVLTVSGRASGEWMARARLIVRVLPGITTFSDESLSLEQTPLGIFLERLEAEPGLMVVATEERDGKHLIRGLKDPLASDPATLLEGTGLAPAGVIFRWEYYQAMDDQIILRRAQKYLDPPKTVGLSFSKGVLTAGGHASPAWVRKAEKAALTVPGVTRYDDRRLLEAGRQEFIRLQEALEGRIIRFVTGTTEVTDQESAEELEATVSGINQLQELADMLGRRLIIAIVGRTDSTGSKEQNFQLSRLRADQVRNLLLSRGINHTDLVSRGVGSSEPLTDETSDRGRMMNRSVIFKVTTEPPLGSEGAE